MNLGLYKTVKKVMINCCFVINGARTDGFVAGFPK